MASANTENSRRKREKPLVPRVTCHRRARRNHRSCIWTEALFAMVNQGSPLVPFHWLVYKVVFLTWIATTWHGGHVCGQYIKNSFPRIFMKSWIFMRIEMFLFLTTNMATMMSLQASDSRNVSLGITYEEWCTHTIHWIKEIFLALEKETVHYLLKHLSRYNPLRLRGSQHWGRREEVDSGKR